MSATIQLGPYRGVTTVMSTELNALGASTGKAISSAIDNSDPMAALDLFDNLELAVDFVTAPTAGTVIEVYLLPSVDGSNYPDGSTSILPQASLYVGGFVVRNDAAAQRMVLRGIPLPPGLFKYVVQNTTNQAFPASGSTLKRNPFQLQSI